MRTPAGKECPHFYQDFNRGRNLQECRLARLNPASLRWKASDCERCPVPAILNANASKYLDLKLTIRPRMLGLGRVVDVQSSCLKHQKPIEDAYVGCPDCNKERPTPDIFWQALEQDSDD